MNDPLLRIVVFGTPGTAGSKSAFPLWRQTPDGGKQFVGTAQVEEDLQKVKANWRVSVMAAAQRLILDADGRIKPPFPLDEPLHVDLVFTVKKPASATFKTRRTWPMTRPDRSKYARATEDALIAAGVLKDDSRIVDGRLAKVFPGEDPDALDVPGALIRIWRMHDLVGWQRDTPVDNPDETLFEVAFGDRRYTGGVSP